MPDIIKQLKDSGLTGRGGACFPVWQKWTMVKNAKGKEKYVVCNASEGEPGIMKDYFVLDNLADRVIDGMKIAIDFLSAQEGYIYLNPDYHKILKKPLEKAVAGEPVNIFKKSHEAGYIGGEESSALNHIEGKRVEPRLRPPFPTTHGLYGRPTLINNVETFYAVSLIASGEYERKRYYTINGDCLWTGVYEFPEDMTIKEILKGTKNYPNFDFFVQVGGNASGEVLNSKQLERPAGGGASITVYSVIKHQPLELIRGWIDFFRTESCGQCTPCREGTYRLQELLNDKKPNWQMFADLLVNLNDSAFCGLGCAVPVAVRSYVVNVLARMPDNKIKLSRTDKRTICECFN